ncbi:UbiA prenyltransferase family protein [Halpernia frigidisoli]|uniref:Prenyltransferase n=1 Tax=Halpernia frigidisoli TaxID=1125876 RepID=A0A1I3E9U4_9FLAO|nr:hypothetical protein [Halpernia frigidisoli]SFH95760.1 hypothetical protein SAMN05443292_0956 [Halpernia frigidisoli]
MNFLKISKKYVIDSQLYVSLMGTSFAIFFMLHQNIFRFPTVLLIFITYFSGYVYTKYQGNKVILFKILAFNCLCGLISVFLILQNHNFERLVRWGIIVFIGLLYDSFFLKYYIRKIPLFKVFYVGLTWALINSWLILPEMHWPIFFISWLFITALVLPFDIRDMKSDDVITFPQLIGVQNTKYLAYIFVFISLIISILYLNFLYCFSIYLTSVFTFIVIYFSETKRRETYFSFWVESCSLLPLLFLMILK